MDYAGIDVRNLRFPVNRPLSDSERLGRLDKNVKASEDPCSLMSVIRVNSTFMELVDRWYPGKGFNAWLGLMAGLAYLPMSGYFLWNIIIFGPPFKADEQWIPWAFGLFILPVSVFIIAGVYWLVRSECFRWTHYPMRLNRKERKVYVFRQNGTVFCADWDKLFFFIGESTTPPLGKTNDLRMHLLSDDGGVVLETYTLGYAYMSEREDLMRLWEFFRQYMEYDNGPELAAAEVPIFLPIHDRREGFLFGVFRAFASFMRFPVLHLIFSIPFGFISLCRWLAMTTSRIPTWPHEVQAANEISAGDPFQRDWRDNNKLGFVELIWPLICTVIGVVCGVWIVWSMIQATS